MKRNSELLANVSDPVRIAANLPLGPEAAFFTGARGFMGQEKDPSVVAFNDPPADQPSLWCQWAPSANSRSIEWNKEEKFYHYAKWIEYLIANFLRPWGYTLNGEVRWKGEMGDQGTIVIAKNEVSIHQECGKSAEAEAINKHYAMKLENLKKQSKGK